ncbi:hypothetical protein KAR91_39145 [Candidatus Pacearchaeota archaeon]|nr:hypothetical protein [Candidatus Pacearchaeota archaeon]
MSHVFRNGEEQFGDFLDEDNYLSVYLLDTAAVDMTVNGTTPVIYRYTCPADTRVALNRGLLTIEHGGAAFAPGVFGALGAALTNGVEISITPSGGSKVVLETWKTNRQIRDTMFDLDQTFKTNGVYTGRWTFTKDLNNNGLILTPGDVFDFKIQDNLSSMTYMSFKLKGIKKVIT